MSIGYGAARSTNPGAAEELNRRVMEIIGDPLPYGIEPNRRNLEELVRHATTQGIITKPVTVEELFAAETRGLVA